MENPESRPPAAKLIAQVLKEHRMRTIEGVVGLSAAMTVYNSLKQAGYLRDFDEPDHCPWDCSRCHASDGVCEDEDGIPIEGWWEE